MTLLNLTPAEFWRLTPAETADMIAAFKKRENRTLMRHAWEVSLLIAPNVKEGEQDKATTLALFKQIPGAFPDDLDLSEPPAATADGNETERERRKRVKRIQLPR